MHKKKVTLSAKRGQRKMWGRHSSCRKPCGKEHRKSWGNRCPSFLQFLVVVTVSNLPVPLSLCQSLGDSRIIPSRKLRQKPIKCMGTSATVYGSTKLWVFRVGFWKNGKFAHFCKKGGDYWRNCRSVTLVSLLKKNPPGSYTQAQSRRRSYMHLPRAKHALPTCLSSVMRLLPWWKRATLILVMLF